MDRSLASQLFDALRASSVLEDRIGDALSAAGISFEDWHVDAYDGSIEIMGCARLSAEQERALWALGFDRAWTHPGTEKVRTTEVFYAAPRKDLRQEKQS